MASIYVFEDKNLIGADQETFKQEDILMLVDTYRRAEKNVVVLGCFTGKDLKSIAK